MENTKITLPSGATINHTSYFDGDIILSDYNWLYDEIQEGRIEGMDIATLHTSAVM